ncbi:MipA/OmpV family protein [Achromobacter ruhlandii]|uniref:MipA/OmpV family protein n=1 Tax=Achromobacter ruhlandii TaxID=72557 RepID=UPI0021F1321C|nr:MipA/OmpV family protein [Achromobacter ruhlandii]MCV6800288.1 MipA/OmpV family protein [Achromobacter ruhlandii]MCV6806058.1 MipA/OmpV family protein [Achromobacter ruhlandii]MCV6811221.1 MipA/OmpV family protein [Achromobacter ruhlandii]MCV6819773.1 MipA/OmpV family protein [Achromobacter ruhlandii]
MKLAMLATGAATAAALACAAAPAQADQPGTNFIGLSVGYVPVYEGSREYRALPVPLVNYHSGNFFISPRAGLPAMGLQTALAPDWKAGVFVGMGLGRDSSDADRTKGLDDIDFHGTYGAFVEWAPGPLSLGAAYRQAARSGYGGTLELRATYSAWQEGAHRVNIGASTQWASHDAMQTWYGVTSSQAASSRAGLSTYSPGSGFKSAALFTTWSYRINPSWSTITTLGVNTLLGDARDSPLTERRTNMFGSVGVVYAF